MFSWGGTWKGLERLLGCQFKIVNWPSVYPPLKNLWSWNENNSLEFWDLWEASEYAIEIAPHSSYMKSGNKMTWMWKCDWNCTSIICSLGVELEKDWWDFWGANLWSSIGCLCIHPYRNYDPGTRTVPESSGIFQKQSSGIWSTGLSWWLLMGEHTLENAQRLSCSFGVELERD